MRYGADTKVLRTDGWRERQTQGIPIIPLLLHGGGNKKFSINNFFGEKKCDFDIKSQLSGISRSLFSYPKIYSFQTYCEKLILKARETKV